MAGTVQDDIRRFQLEINTSNKNGETLAQLTKLEKETAKLRNENTELQKVMAHLAATGRKDTEEYKRMEAQLKLNRKAVSQNSDEMKGLQKNLDLNYMSMTQLKKRAGELRSTLNSMSKAANPEEYARLETELSQVGSQMDKLKGKTNQTKGVFANLKSAAGGLLPAFGWTAIIAGAVNLGKKIYELAKQTGAYRTQIQGLTGIGGKELVELTANLEATAKTFNVEQEKLAIANHNFAESMNISEKAANDLINRGFLAGADASGEFLDRLREYGPQFKAAGLSAEESIALMTQEVKTGIYSDKGTDAIKEATLALREMPQTTRDAVDAIGLSSDEMMKQLASGEITIFEAMQKVSRKMAELPPQSAEVGQAMADIFKGAGEDAGLDYILMLGQAQSSMDDLTAQTSEAAEQSKRMLEVNKELALEWGNLLGEGTGAISSWTTTAQIFIKEGLLNIIKWFKELRVWVVDLYNNSAGFRGIIQTIGLAFKFTFQTAKTSILEFWELLKGLGNSVKAIFTRDFASIDDIWKQTFINMKDIAAYGAKKSGEAAVNAWNKTVNGKIEMPGAEPEFTPFQTVNKVVSSSTGTGSTGSDKQSADAKKQAEKVKELVLKAQNELNNAKIASLKDGIQKEKALEEQRWLEEKQSLESRLVQKEKLTDDELKLNQSLNEQIELKKEDHLKRIKDLEEADRVRLELEKLNIAELEAQTEEEKFAARLEKLQFQFEEEFAQAEGNRLLELEAEKRFNDEILALEEEKKNLKLETYIAEKEITLAKIGLAREAFGTLKSLFKQESAMYKALFLLEQAAAVGQVFFNTAIANAKAVAAFPLTAGQPWVGINTVSAGISISGILAQAIKSLAIGGFAGYTGPGSKYDKKQLTQLHADEYVIPKEGVNNPNIKPFIDIMEQQRVAGTIGSMNFPKVASAAVGGFTNSQTQQNSTSVLDASGMAAVVGEFKAAVNDLRKGVPAYFDEKQTREITEQQEFDATLLNKTKF